MEYIVFCITIIFLFVVLVISGWIDNARKKKRFIEKLRKEYGSFGTREYLSEQYASISYYFQRHSKEKKHLIDDITYQDLNMNRLFQIMNTTLSSAGEEYLYYTLRTPKAEQKTLEQQEKLVQYFDTHEEERIAFQCICKELGRTGKYSLYEYLEYLDTLGKRSNGFQHIINLLFVPSVFLLLLSAPLGICVILFFICFNMITYFKEKDKIAPYITCFVYIMRLLHAVDTIKRSGITALEEQVEQLEKCRMAFRKFKRGSSLVMAEASGNPLQIVFDYMKMVFHIDIIKFNAMLGEVRQHTQEIDTMVSVIGYLETTIAIANFRKALPYYCMPVFQKRATIATDSIYHPYIENPVANSITAKRGILLTGSNASGKSTFLRTIAINAVLAQTIYTATAKSYVADFFQIYSSMSLHDSLQQGESYYMVEIKSLKRILDAVSEKEEELPVVCFIDEVLRGTNTIERIAASTQVLRSLQQGNVLCFAATHDIELTKLLEDLYENYHFTETVKDGDVSFSYRLLTGAATTRNAIRLLQMMGYRQEIVDKAEQLAESFSITGKWNQTIV